MTSQPTLTWTLTGGGSLTSGGLYRPPYSAGSATVEAASGAKNATATVTYSGQAQWTSAVAASWTAAYWENTVSGNTIAAPGVRGITGDTIMVGSAATGNIDLNGASPSIAAVTFSAASGAAIAQGSGGSLVLNNGTNPATLTVTSGTHTISAPIVLDSNVKLLPAPGTQLTLSGGLSGAGYSLTVAAGGTVVLSGANSYTGGSIVAMGTLVMTNSSSIPTNMGLTIGAGGTFIFDPRLAAASGDPASAVNGNRRRGCRRRPADEEARRPCWP